MGKAVARLLDDYSLEATAKDIDALEQAAPALRPGTLVSVPWLPAETMAARCAAAVAIRRLGFTPVPHIAARRVKSRQALQDFLARCTGEARVDHLLVIAGDSAEPEGPYRDALAVIESGLLADHGIAAVTVSGHPEGHPAIGREALMRALQDKSAALGAQGMDCRIATQFAFDADAILRWLAEIRAAGISHPVRIGVPGPASIKALLRFAALCGVEASAKVLAKYGLSLTRLIGTAGPDRLVDALEARLDGDVQGRVQAHFYPFGGIGRTVQWAGQWAAARQSAAETAA